MTPHQSQRFIVLVALILTFPLALLAQDIPVMVNQTSEAKVMMVIDDSGSMQAVMEHPDFDADGTTATNSSLEFPSIVFKLESGVSAPATGHTLTPIIFEMNWGLWYRSGGNVYSGTTFSSASNMRLVSAVTCNDTRARTRSCPGSPSSPTRGVNTLSLYGNSSIVGSSVFQLSNLAQSGSTTVTDSSGNEYLYANYRRNDYVRSARDWHSIWPKFDANGDSVTVRTRAYATTGGTMYFNGKEVFLSAGWYRLEYLRWIFYEATADQIANLPGATRVDTVKDVVETLILNNASVEFGIATLNGSTYNAGVHSSGSYGNQMWTPMGDASSGARPKIRATIGTSSADLITALETVTAMGGTPLANTYIETLRYFAGERDRDPYSNRQYVSPIDSECAASFIILLTDGLPTSESHNMVKGSWIRDYDGDGEDGASTNRNCSTSRCKEFLDDAAFYAYDTDFNTSIDGTQNIRSYAVGLGLDFDLLDDFAQNGGSGTALRADTSDEISDALQNIVNNLITTAVGAAGVAVAEVFGEHGQVFRPRFEAAHWSGNIDKYLSNSSGDLIKSFDMGDILEERDLDSDPRTIIAGYDEDGDGNTDTTIEFKTDNATVLREYLFADYITGTADSALLAEPIRDYTLDTSAETLIDFIHGYDFEDMRERDSDGDENVEKLGDIVYSRPKYVSAKNGSYNRMHGYIDFVRGRISQPEILLVGANDGMLHAFDVDTGEELWAYIPSSLLKYLEVLSRESYNNEYHRYYVDGQVAVEDVYVGGSWRTIAMFGLRKGGATWTVLDITDRSNPELLFEVSDLTNAGQSWGNATVVVTGGSTNNYLPGGFNWYMVVPTGEGKTTNGNNLLAYTLTTTGMPTKSVVSISSETAGTRLTGVATSQNDQDLNVDRAYVGSESGDLYRVLTNGSPGSWSVQKLFNGSSNQPLTAQAVTVLVDNPIYGGSGITTGPESHKYAVGVFFGSGRYDSIADVTDVGTVAQDIIAIFDPLNITDDTYQNRLSTVGKSDLENQSYSSFSPVRSSDGVYRVPDTKSGFYISMATEIQLIDNHYIKPVGMVTHKPTNVRGNVLFATFLPKQEQCTAGGYGFIQGVNFRAAGGSVVDYFLDEKDPFYNGGIPDINEDASYDEIDLELGYDAGTILPALDTYVNSIEADDLRPYNHDGTLTIEDVFLHASNGGVKPAVSSLGATGVPGPPAILYQAGQIVIQAAYIANAESENGDDDEEDDTVSFCCTTGSGDDTERHTVVVSESEAAEYDADPSCERKTCEEDEQEDKIKICHYPPGNPANMHTIEVSENAWPAHEAHGDTRGACDEDEEPEEEPEEEEETEEEEPETQPINLYNVPVNILSFHELTEN